MNRIDRAIAKAIRNIEGDLPKTLIVTVPVEDDEPEPGSLEDLIDTAINGFVEVDEKP